MCKREIEEIRCKTTTLLSICKITCVKLKNRHNLNLFDLVDQVNFYNKSKSPSIRGIQTGDGFGYFFEKWLPPKPSIRRRRGCLVPVQNSQNSQSSQNSQNLQNSQNSQNSQNLLWILWVKIFLWILWILWVLKKIFCEFCEFCDFFFILNLK